MGGSQAAHEYAVGRILAHLSSVYGARVFAWAQHVGLFKKVNGGQTFVGVTGMGDIGGWLDGFAFQIEVKTGEARQRPSQEGFQKMCAASGAYYTVAHFSGKWSQADEEELSRIEADLSWWIL